MNFSRKAAIFFTPDIIEEWDHLVGESLHRRHGIFPDLPTPRQKSPSSSQQSLNRGKSEPNILVHSQPLSYDKRPKSMKAEKIPASESPASYSSNQPHHVQLARRFSNADVMTKRSPGSESGSKVKDEYGFELDEEIAALAHKSKEAAMEKENKQLQLWINYLEKINYSSANIVKNKALIRMVRNGIPKVLRGQIWQILSGVSTFQQSSGADYNTMVKIMEDILNDQNSTYADEIENDIARTFPGHEIIGCKELMGRLRRVLTVYAHHNPEIGYCQSMNFIAATLLLFLGEEETFWMFSHIVENILPPQYFCNELLGVIVDNRVFGQLLLEKLPKLHSHLQGLDVNYESFTFQWFLCLYVNIVPYETAMRIWDCLMCEGNKIIMRMGITIFGMLQKKLMNSRSLAEVMDVLQNEPRKFVNSDQFISLAWKSRWMLSFPRNRIVELRDFFTIQVTQDMADIRQQREQIQPIKFDFHDREAIPSDTSDPKSSDYANPDAIDPCYPPMCLHSTHAAFTQSTLHTHQTDPVLQISRLNGRQIATQSTTVASSSSGESLCVSLAQSYVNPVLSKSYAARNTASSSIVPMRDSVVAALSSHHSAIRQGTRNGDPLFVEPRDSDSEEELVE